MRCPVRQGQDECRQGRRARAPLSYVEEDPASASVALASYYVETIFQLPSG